MNLTPLAKLKRIPWLLVLAVVALGIQAGRCAASDAQHAAAAAAGFTRHRDAPPNTARAGPAAPTAQAQVTLPPPSFKGTHSLEQLLQQRRSVREFAATPLTLAQLGQLLWAAQGITADGKLRAAPSSGALYPLELYIAVGHVDGLPAGIYHYAPHAHRLQLVQPGDHRRALAAAAVRQTWLATAPAIIVFGAVHARTAAKYGSRTDRYVHIEAGHAAQNVYLQAGDLGLGTCDVGAFDDREIASTLQWPGDVSPLLLMPVGVAR